MKHKIIALALMLLSAFSGGVCASAQNVGEWHLFSLFSDGVTSIVDAKNKVYYVSSQRLYSYDKRSSETYSYSTENVLSDTNVTGIYYNAAKGYLMVTYDTSNIDIILDKDDSVVNMSDISIANLTYTKTINGVAFSGDRIYVATDFGLVVFNDNNFTVAESGIYGISIKYICVSGTTLLVYSDAKYYYTNVDSRINTFDKLKFFRTGYSGGIYGTDNGFYEYDAGTKLLRLRIIDWDKGVTNSTVDTNISKVLSYNKKHDGECYFVTDSEVVFFDETDGSITSRVALPDGIASKYVNFYDDLNSAWVGTNDGVAGYSISDGSATQLADKTSKPEAITCNEVAYIRPAKDGSRVYISNLGKTNYKSIGQSSSSDNGFDIVQRTDVIINGVPYNAALYNATQYKWGYEVQKEQNSTAMYGGCERFDVDKDDPEKYYIANFTEGFYVVKNNEEVAKFDSSNMPINNWWTSTKQGAVGENCEIDPDGNLWLGYYTNDKTGTYGPYLMLAKKYLSDPTSVTANDWKVSKHLGVDAGGHDMGSLFCKKSTKWFTWTGGYQKDMGVYETQGTYDDVDDDYYEEFTSHYDSDGNSFLPTRWICAVEDKKGAVWFGSTAGICTISDPSKVTQANASTYNFSRPKVPRNDGTNYADYLLESEQINDISVDASNRKWIATENSGLYCVSEDGDEIIDQFTTDNSPLPSNAVYSVYCDPNSNLIYIGLKTGLMTYRTDTTPAQSDYSAVLAYPNPVRPEYTGWITVSGLVDNSLVKFADTSGNVVYQTQSKGGMAVWDGCNPDGSRVNTGVYLVLASASENDNTMSVVTKILIVK